MQTKIPLWLLGFDNSGDDIILKAMVKDIKNMDNVKITAFPQSSFTKIYDVDVITDFTLKM